eukprot:1194615-Prorocentrum_minimum.AAC.8
MMDEMGKNSVRCPPCTARSSFASPFASRRNRSAWEGKPPPPHDLAFSSVEHIMRDVEGGWLSI